MSRGAQTRMRAGRRLPLGLLLLAALAALALGCTGGAPPLALPAGAQVLQLAATTDVPTLDPAAGYDSVSWTFEQMIFDTLVRYSDAGVDVVPDIAVAWESSPDATLFTFHLRKDARFSNGRSVTGDDFRFGIERVLDPRSHSQGMEYFREIVGAEDFIARRATHVRGIETPDPWTIAFRLAKPDPIFVEKLAMPFAAAVPREVVARYPDDFSRHAMGSGPFMVQEWLGGQRLVLVRNPHYFAKGAPRLDAIVATLNVSEELQWLKFEAGEIDVSSIPPAEFPYVLKTPRLSALVAKKVTLSTDYLGMNCRMRPFDDARVRRALNYAINKRKLIALLNGRGVPARGVLPPGMPGYDPALAGYRYDPGQARRLLEEAGVGRGFRPELWIRADQTEIILAQSVQQDLALVGVDVTLKPVAWAPLLEAVRQPDTVPFMFLAWEADFPDPENFLAVLFSREQWGSNNDVFYYNPEVERLLAAAAPVGDGARRLELYGRAEKILVADAPWVFLFHPVTYVIIKPWVHDYVLNPMRPTRLERVWLSARDSR